MTKPSKTLKSHAGGQNKRRKCPEQTNWEHDHSVIQAEIINNIFTLILMKIRSYDGLCSRMAMVDHCRRWDEEWGLQTSRRKAAAKSFQLSVSLDARQTNFWAARQKDSILNLYGSCVRRLICTKVGDIKSNLPIDFLCVALTAIADFSFGGKTLCAFDCNTSCRLYIRDKRSKNRTNTKPRCNSETFNIFDVLEWNSSTN